MSFLARYPVDVHPEEDGKGYYALFPDLTEAMTSGADLEECVAEEADRLEEAMAGRIARGEDIPLPRKAKKGQEMVSVPLGLAPKVALYLAMRESGVTNPEVARRLGLSETVVRRMLNPRHVTKPERIQAALRVLGKRIVVGFVDAA